MDSTSTLEYAEKIVTFDDKTIILHDISHATAISRPFANITQLIQLDDRLLIVNKQSATFNFYHLVSKDFEIIDTDYSTFDDTITSVDAVLLPKNKILLMEKISEKDIPSVRYYIYSNNLSKKKLINHFGELIAFFQTQSEAISINKFSYQSITCSSMKLNKADSFQKKRNYLLVQLGDVIDVKCIDNSDNFVICAVGQKNEYNHYLKIINSDGEILFQPEIGNFISYFWEVDNSHLIFCTQYYQLYNDSNNYQFYRFFRKDDKWVMTAPIKQIVDNTNLTLGRPETQKLLITKTKIIAPHLSQFYHVFDKETTKYLYRMACPNLPIHYDYYNAWCQTELERLMDLDVLKRLSKNLLAIILSYVS